VTVRRSATDSTAVEEAETYARSIGSSCPPRGRLRVRAPWRALAGGTAGREPSTLRSGARSIFPIRSTRSRSRGRPRPSSSSRRRQRARPRAATSTPRTTTRRPARRHAPRRADPRRARRRHRGRTTADAPGRARGRSRRIQTRPRQPRLPDLCRRSRRVAAQSSCAGWGRDAARNRWGRPPSRLSRTPPASAGCRRAGSPLSRFR
jgi:hypothetical protein